MPGSALIGSTGFVGTNLLRQRTFDHCYHRPNIQEIDGQHFDLVICAGAPAEKWRANQSPIADRQNLERLAAHLARMQAEQFVLVSTVDVYPSPIGVDETTPIDPAAAHPYGRNRFWLEQRCRDLFSSVTIVRLPGLFGPGLKKNLLFDLVHQRNLELTDHRSVFQFYDIRRLWSDLRTGLAAGVELLNLATEPVRAADVAKTCFGVDLTTETAAGPVAYDMRSVHTAIFGRSGPYLATAAETTESIRDWAHTERPTVNPGGPS
ncbi:MAG: NAD-dependent epimerase/dehydratase family protein [Acidimicrobiales bacterium]|nr:NAD-dependent epimerase/dehydratase family protein [Acidimicrobiales bacterium]